MTVDSFLARRTLQLTLLNPIVLQNAAQAVGQNLKSGPFVLRMFGSMKLEGTDQIQTKFTTKRSALILARLAVAREQRIGREELAELLWPDEFLDQTRLRLRQELLRLRQAAGEFGAFIHADRSWISIEPGFLTTDVQQFEGFLASASSQLNPLAKADYLSKAVALYDGPFLASHQEPWVQATRRTYSERVRCAWLDLAECLQAVGEHGGALEATNNAVRHDPLDTTANTLLIRRLVDRGQSVRARDAFVEFDALLFRELGRHASPAMRAEIGIEPGSGETPESIELADSRTVIRPLPLFGREGEIERIVEAVSRQGAIVCLVGMIGIGKSHLIHEAAWRFSKSTRLPVKFGGDPEPVADGLFVIDTEMNRSAMVDLTRRASQVGWRVLVESRARTDSGIFDEIPIGPLPPPSIKDSPDSINANPTIQLLLSNTGELGKEPSNSAIAFALADIARKLDGHPSALQSFSYRLMVDTPDQVISRIDIELIEFVNEGYMDRKSIRETLSELTSDLTDQATEALIALSILDGASTDLASKITRHQESSDAWRHLEKRSLISISGQGEQRRFRVPKPIAVAIRQVIDPGFFASTEAKTWQTVAEWSYQISRQMTGSNQESAFSISAAELENLKRGIHWAIDNDPGVAAYLVVATWRTVCARGHPALDGDLLYRAAYSGADKIAPIFGGEAWMGAAVTLSNIGKFEAAERAYLEAIRIFELGGHDSSVGWAQTNYAVTVLSFIDKPRAMEMLESVISSAVNADLRTLARTDHALLLASTGVIGEPIRVAEEIFSEGLQSHDHTMHARAYVDLGELYQVAGRPEAARPLIIEGIKRLREAGIQYMLLDQLIYLGQLTIDDEKPDWALISELVEEANEIAIRMGSKRKQLKVSRLRLAHASRNLDGLAMLNAIDETFQLTHSSESAVERERSLRALAVELHLHGRPEYANAALASLGDEVNGSCHVGWVTNLSTGSHSATCVLAVVMAKEALNLSNC